MSFVAVLLLVSWLCYRFIERPGRLKIKALEKLLLPYKDRLLAKTAS